MDVVRPDECDDPVAAVRAARDSGAVLSLATSGSSGVPRRVWRTTQSWWGAFPAYSALSGVTSGARLWLPGPLTSTMVLYAAVHAAVVGATVVSGPGEATHACATPSQLDRLGERLPRGCVVTTAGAHLPPRVAEAAAARGLDVRHYYGAAELSFVASGRPGQLRTFEGVEVELRDTPHPGTIWVRSPWLCVGYDGAPGSFVREGDWATVGDAGQVADGRLTVTGRPDAVVTGGATVLVADVEAALRPCATGDFVVHGEPHPTLGEVLACTLTDPADREPLEHAARALGPAHRPRLWRVVDALPLTDAGKVDRAALSTAARA